MSNLKHRETLTNLLRKIVSMNRPGLVLKNYRKAFNLVDDAIDPYKYPSAPSCLTMPMITAHVQEQHIIDVLDNAWPSMRNAIQESVEFIRPRWVSFCKGCGNEKPILDITQTDWPDMNFACPALSMETGKCEIEWGRPFGCLAINPAFIWISQQIDDKVYGKKEFRCVPIIETLKQYFEGQHSSRIPILPKR